MSATQIHHASDDQITTMAIKGKLRRKGIPVPDNLNPKKTGLFVKKKPGRLANHSAQYSIYRDPDRTSAGWEPLRAFHPISWGPIKDFPKLPWETGK